MAMARIEHIVSEEQPATLDMLAFILLRTMYFQNTSAVAFSLLRQFSAMSAVILPKQHPFNQVFARLVRLDMSHLKYTLIMARESQSDGFARRLGRFNLSTLQILVSSLELKSIEGAAHTAEGYLTLLQTMQLVLDIADPRILWVRNQLAYCYLAEGEFTETAEIAQGIIDLAAQTGNVPPYRCASAIDTLSRAQYRLSETTLAEQNLRQAIHIRATYIGWENALVLQCMSLLEDWLEEWRRPDEAAEVRRQRDEILDLMEDRITREEEERCQRLGIKEA